jgi:lysozyme
MIVGNDISGHQGQIDFGVYKNNTNFVIIKMSEGTSFIDPMAGYNRQQARLMGIPLGYYHFARPDLGNSPQAEADFFCRLIDGDPIKEGESVYLDYECANQKQSDVDWCKAWLDVVSKHFGGMKPMIYLNQSQVKAFNWKVVVDAGYALWLASYQGVGVGDTGQWPSMAMQQWTSSQQVPGTLGSLDGDWFFGDVNAFKAYGYKKPIPVPINTPSASPSRSPSASPSSSPSVSSSTSPSASPSDPCLDLRNKMKQINTLASGYHFFYSGTFKKILDLSKA